MTKIGKGKWIGLFIISPYIMSMATTLLIFSLTDYGSDNSGASDGAENAKRQKILEEGEIVDISQSPFEMITNGEVTRYPDVYSTLIEPLKNLRSISRKVGHNLSFEVQKNIVGKDGGRKRKFTIILSKDLSVQSYSIAKSENRKLRGVKPEDSEGYSEFKTALKQTMEAIIKFMAIHRTNSYIRFQFYGHSDGVKIKRKSLGRRLEEFTDEIPECPEPEKIELLSQEAIAYLRGCWIMHEVYKTSNPIAKDYRVDFKNRILDESVKGKTHAQVGAQYRKAEIRIWFYAPYDEEKRPMIKRENHAK